MGLTWDTAMCLRENIVEILGDSCCFVIAAPLFPDTDPNPAIAAEVRQSNVHLPGGTDKLMDRLAATAASKDYRPPILEPWPPAAFPLGHAAGGGISHSQRPAGHMGHRTKALEAVPDRRTNPPRPHPHRSPSIGARPLSPIPARA